MEHRFDVDEGDGEIGRDADVIRGHVPGPAEAGSRGCGTADVECLLSPREGRHEQQGHDQHWYGDSHRGEEQYTGSVNGSVQGAEVQGAGCSVQGVVQSVRCRAQGAGCTVHGAPCTLHPAPHRPMRATRRVARRAASEQIETIETSTSAPAHACRCQSSYGPVAYV